MNSTPQQELELAVWEVVKRWGGRGVSEGVIPSLVVAHYRPTIPADCYRAVERLIADGHLYRAYRRTRALVKAGPQPGPGTTPQAEGLEPQPGLWDPEEEDTQ